MMFDLLVAQPAAASVAAAAMGPLSIISSFFLAAFPLSILPHGLDGHYYACRLRRSGCHGAPLHSHLPQLSPDCLPDPKALPRNTAIAPHAAMPSGVPTPCHCRIFEAWKGRVHGATGRLGDRQDAHFGQKLQLRCKGVPIQDFMIYGPPFKEFYMQLDPRGIRVPVTAPATPTR